MERFKHTRNSEIGSGGHKVLYIGDEKVAEIHESEQFGVWELNGDQDDLYAYKAEIEDLPEEWADRLTATIEELEAKFWLENQDQ